MIDLNHYAIPPELRARFVAAIREGRDQAVDDFARAIFIELQKAGAANGSDVADVLLAGAEFVETQRAVDEQAAQSESPFPALLDLAALAQREPVPPRFIIDGWLPEGQATLFAGHGGAGKSLIALTAAVCIAAGRPFYGLRGQRRRVMFVSFEDSNDVLHWRLRRVCAMLNIDLAALAGWLFVFDASGSGEPLYVETRDGAAPTAAFDWLRAALTVHAAQVAVIDGSADAFAGNENARAQVRAFVQSVRRLVPRDGALLLLHHVDATTAHGGSKKGYSGSTAWHNSARARWFLGPESEGEDADPARVVLELRKSNHGKPGASLVLRFDESAGCFVAECEPVASPLARAMRESDERTALIDLIRAAYADGNPLPAAATGQRTAHSVADARDDMPQALRGRRGRSRFYRHVEALRAAGAVRVEAVRKANRHAAEVLRAAS